MKLEFIQKLVANVFEGIAKNLKDEFDEDEIDEGWDEIDKAYVGKIGTLMAHQRLLEGADFERAKNPKSKDSYKSVALKNLTKDRDFYKKAHDLKAEEAITKSPEGGRRVASVAVIHDDKLLMGKRRDNGLWTMPGGHVDDGETMHQGALRELNEEASIEAEKLKPITKLNKLKDHKGQDLHVQGFALKLKEKVPTSMQGDPDGEVEKWQWIDTSKGLPPDVSSALHVPKERNIVLQELGLVDGVAKAEPEPAKQYGDGLKLDLASGAGREPGFIGVDLYPHDDSTLVHDLSLGLPFPDNTASEIRMSNAGDYLTDVNPAYLCKEIVRVLKPGGKFSYQGVGKMQAWDGMQESADGSVMKGEMCSQSFVKKDDYTPAIAEDSDPIYNMGLFPELGPDDVTSMNTKDAITSLSREYIKPKKKKPNAVNKSAQVFCEIMKADKMKQIAYGVVLTPDEMDAQEDWMTPDEIEKSAHYYMENFRVVGDRHTKPTDSVVVESYIAPQDLTWENGTYGPQVVKKGSWVMAVKVKSPKLWQKVLTGEYQAFSVGGQGLRS